MNPSTLTFTDTHQQQEAAYDPCQLQAYDQSSYYTHQYNQQQHSTTQQQYPYYPPDYTSIYHQQPQHHEPTSIHPPGVPIPPEPSTHLAVPDYGQTQLQNQQNGYYPHGIAAEQQQQWQGNGGGFGAMPLHYPPIGQSPYRGGGRRGRRPFRGCGRGRVGFHGRGSGQYGSSEGNAAYIQGQGPQALMPQPSQVHATPFWPPLHMAWCELCRVDCNTLEILEQHKTGKKHKRNLQVHEELQNLNKVMTGMQNYQMPISESKLEVVHPEKVEGSVEKQAPQENLPFEISVADPTNGAERKRNMRGRGGKRMRTSDGPRRPIKLPKPKQIIPLICELCNIKCESQVVLDSHLAGKKHLSNLKRFHGYQAVVGAAVCQANPGVPSISLIPQVNQKGDRGPQDYVPHPQPYTLPQAPGPALSSAFALAPKLAPASSPAAASTSTASPFLKTDDQQDSNHGSQAMTETGNQSSATTKANKSQQQSSIVNGAMVTETANSELVEAATLPKDNFGMALFEPPVKGTEQVPSATAIGKAATTSADDVTSSKQVVLSGFDCKVDGESTICEFWQH